MRTLLEPTIQVAVTLAALALWLLILRRLERRRPSDVVPNLHVGDTLIPHAQARKPCLTLRSINNGCYVPPSQGGCWFCHSDKGEMLFSVEFDTFFHWECLKQIIDATPDDWYDPEAEIIAREFGLRQ